MSCHLPPTPHPPPRPLRAASPPSSRLPEPPARVSGRRRQPTGRARRRSRPPRPRSPMPGPRCPRGPGPRPPSACGASGSVRSREPPASPPPAGGGGGGCLPPGAVTALPSAAAAEAALPREPLPPATSGPAPGRCAACRERNAGAMLWRHFRCRWRHLAGGGRRCWAEAAEEGEAGMAAPGRRDPRPICRLVRTGAGRGGNRGGGGGSGGQARACQVRGRRWR